MSESSRFVMIAGRVIGLVLVFVAGILVGSWLGTNYLIPTWLQP